MIDDYVKTLERWILSNERPLNTTKPLSAKQTAPLPQSLRPPAPFSRIVLPAPHMACIGRSQHELFKIITQKKKEKDSEKFLSWVGC